LEIIPVRKCLPCNFTAFERTCFLSEFSYDSLTYAKGFSCSNRLLYEQVDMTNNKCLQCLPEFHVTDIHP